MVSRAWEERTGGSVFNEERVSVRGDERVLDDSDAQIWECT